jgi:hypothetical protein
MGVSCRPAQIPPLIEIHDTNDGTPEKMISAFIHEDIHIALHRIDSKACGLFDLVEYSILEPDINTFPPTLGEPLRAMQSEAGLFAKEDK